MKILLVLLVATACCAEHLTKENEEVIEAMIADKGDSESIVVDASEKDQNIKDGKDKEPHRPALHFPSIPSFQIIPQVQFPGFHFPPIPLPQLPSLPSLPQFSLPDLPRPFQKKETVFKTKTVYIEHTHRVTRHPVCVTAYVPKPACLYDHEVKDIAADRELEEIVAAQRAHEIQPTSVISELPAATRLIESLDDSESDSENEALEDQMATYRRARYLVAHPQRGSEPEKQESAVEATEPLLEPTAYIKVKPFEQHIQVPHGGPIHGQHHGTGLGGVHHDGGLQHHQEGLLQDSNHGEDHQIVHGLLKVTHFVTKTLLVTNVQKVIDHKVTATLIAKNCLPSEYIIPHCDKHVGFFKNREEVHQGAEEVDESSEVDPRTESDYEAKQTSVEYEEQA